MRLDMFPRQCVSCPSKPPVCTCSADESCVQISQSCNACPTFTCQPTSSSRADTASAGISSGALAGAIVALLLVLIGALVLFFLYRRRQRARRARDAAAETKQDVPAPAEAVLNRPDPIEKPQPSLPIPEPTPTSTVRVYASSGDTVINLDPRAQDSLSSRSASGRHPKGNPFDDVQSIQTTSTTTNGTNVIPIALVSPGSVQPPSPHSDSASLPSNYPVRPSRPTDLVLDSPNRSQDSVPDSTASVHYEPSERSVLSRVSYASNLSYSSDFLNEAPMIVTHTRGAVRQVVGKVRAEVIQTPGTLTPTSHVSSDTLKSPSAASRPSIRSPLAATSFGPADVVNEEVDDEHELSSRSDPFGDHHASSTQVLLTPVGARAGLHLDSPPLQQGSSAESGKFDKSPQIATITKIIPPSPVPSDSLQEQQRRALAHAQAQARAQGLDKHKRMSGTSMVSTASTRADSILESFPFVPPSPISSRPIRSPPRSPLGQQFIAATQSQPPLAKSLSSHPMLPEAETAEGGVALPPLSPPPSRRILGMSTGSQLSTASSGLGNFPFQIDHGGTEVTRPHSGTLQRQRASLDTLALMSDLSSYPLGYDRDDRDSLPPLPKA